MKFLICGLFLFYCSSEPVAPKNKVVLIALDGIKEEHITSISTIDLPKGYINKFYGQKDNCKPSQKYNVSLPAYYTLFTGLNNSKVTSNRFIKDSYDPTLFDIYKDSIGFSSWYPLKYISSSKKEKSNFVLSKTDLNIDSDNQVFKDFKKYYGNQKLAFIHFTDADTTTVKTIFTAGSEGSRILALSIAGDDTVNANMRFYIRKSLINYLIGTVRIPALSGNDGITPSVNGMNLVDMPFLPIDNNGVPYIELAAGELLMAGLIATMTNGKQISVVAQGKDY